MGFPATADDLMAYRDSVFGQHLLAQIEIILDSPVTLSTTESYPEGGLRCLVSKKVTGEPVGIFTLHTMPNCARVVISSDAYVYNAFKNIGIGRLLHAFRLDFLKWVKYPITKVHMFDTVICTVSEENKPELKILKTFGWKQFTQKLWGKELHPQKETT